MTGVIATIPRQQFLDAQGKPLAGGKLYTYLAGTTTPEATYQNQALTTKNENAIPLDATGSCTIWLDPDKSYKFVLKDKKGVTQPGWPVDNVIGAANSISLQPTLGLYAKLAALAAVAGASLIGFIQDCVGAVRRTVQDKLREGYISPEDCAVSALASGADWTAALQKALNSGKNVWLTPGKVYGVTKEITSMVEGITVTGGGTIKVLPGYDVSGGTLSVLSITGENTTLDAVTFDGTGAPHGSLNNRFVWCTAPRLTVTSKASFISLPKGGTNFNGAIGCNSMAPYANVMGAYFYGNPGAIFFQGRNCVAQGNRIINPNDVAIALNGQSCYGCVVIGNMIDNEAYNSCSALIAMEEGAAQWIVQGNRLAGIKDGAGISALNVAVTTNVRGGTITGNIINGGGGTTTNPVAMIAVSPHYQDVQVTHNELYGCPTGNGSSTMIFACATGGVISDNIIDGTGATGLGALMLIYGGVRGLTIKDNTSRLPAGSGCHMLIGADDFGLIPVTFEGGRFFGGAEGINAERDIASITNLLIHIRDIQYSEAATRVNAFTQLGDRCTFMNAGAWSKPHRIGEFTEMYCTDVPAISGRQNYNNGDRMFYFAPAAGTSEGLIRVGGIWHSLANIS